MNTKWLTNPFFVYILSFMLVFAVYSLRWSDMYPALEWPIRFFLFASFLPSFFLGFILEKKRRNEFQTIQVGHFNLLIIALLYFGYLLEFLYEGGIPLLQTLGGGFNYKEFTGIPTFHVVLSTFNLFYSVYLFHQYTSNRALKRTLVYFLLSVSLHLLVLNRGAIMITLIACFFVYLMKIKRLKPIRLVAIPVGALLVIYLFGIIGNIRYSASQEDKNFILRIGGATDRFIESDIPPEFYWGYLYIATPIGNLQNITTQADGSFSLSKLPYFALTEPLPDFIAKRTGGIFQVNESGDMGEKYLVNSALNAPTVYFRSFLLLGWGGIWLMYFHSAIVMLCYPFLIKKSSKYYLTGWVCLCAIILLNVFSNMWQATGTVLIWPLILSLFEKIKLKEKNEAAES